MLLFCIFTTFAASIKHTKMNRKVLLTTLLLSFVFIFISCSKQEPRGELKPISYKGSYNRDFHDLNDLHIESTKKIGINPIEDRESVKDYKKKLVEIETNDYYIVEKLTHSVPFVVPQAYDLLEDLGKRFRKILDEHNAPHYKFIVTSVTRTKEDIAKLSKGNVNASQNSAHMYGTTIDISWKRFSKVDADDPVDLNEEQLKMLLATVLRELKKEDKCYIKHERKQACFHITAR